jgi:hypothetical protein
VAILVLLYLYREPILDHFGLVEISKLKSVLILVAVAVALMIVGTAVIAA